MSQPRSFWVGSALGVPLMVAGVVGAVGDARDARPAELARWLVAGVVVHDVLVVPLVGLAALGAARLTPPWLWPSVRWALATTAVIVVVGWPFVAGYGRRPGNPSALARDYGGGVAVAVASVWAVAVLVAVGARLRAGRKPRRPHADRSPASP